MTDREFKDRLYAEFARVSQALASERRLELIDLLAQAPRRVEALAEESGMTVANVSQHLQVLKAARLVDSTRQGTAVTYRLASSTVLGLWLALRGVAEERLSEIGQLRGEYAPRDEGELPRRDLRSLLRQGDSVLIDVRPTPEFEHEHIPEAISIPVEQLEARLHELPKDKRIIAYCRGKYCLSADAAVALLQERGFDAVRLEGGWPEWALDQGTPTKSTGRNRSRTATEQRV